MTAHATHTIKRVCVTHYPILTLGVEQLILIVAAQVKMNLKLKKIKRQVAFVLEIRLERDEIERSEENESVENIALDFSLDGTHENAFVGHNERHIEENVAQTRQIVEALIS